MSVFAYAKSRFSHDAAHSLNYGSVLLKYWILNRASYGVEHSHTCKLLIRSYHIQNLQPASFPVAIKIVHKALSREFENFSGGMRRQTV